MYNIALLGNFKNSAALWRSEKGYCEGINNFHLGTLYILRVLKWKFSSKIKSKDNFTMPVPCKLTSNRSSFDSEELECQNIKL